MAFIDKIGDFGVGRTLTSIRANLLAQEEALVATRQVLLHDVQWLRVTNATTQDIVLPDATTLPKGWQLTVDIPTTSVASANVKTYHAVTPVLLKNILVGRAYTFTCVDISTAAGLWQINYLEEADLVPTARFASTFNATTDWGAAVIGYYTITITAVTHGRGAEPNVQVYILTGSDFIKVAPDRIYVAANGDTSIRVPEVPDLRFAGKILFV